MWKVSVEWKCIYLLMVVSVWPCVWLVLEEAGVCLWLWWWQISTFSLIRVTNLKETIPWYFFWVSKARLLKLFTVHGSSTHIYLPLFFFNWLKLANFHYFCTYFYGLKLFNYGFLVVFHCDVNLFERMICYQQNLKYPRLSIWSV